MVSARAAARHGLHSGRDVLFFDHERLDPGSVGQLAAGRDSVFPLALRLPNAVTAAVVVWDWLAADGAAASASVAWVAARVLHAAVVRGTGDRTARGGGGAGVRADRGGAAAVLGREPLARMARAQVTGSVRSGILAPPCGVLPRTVSHF